VTAFVRSLRRLREDVHSEANRVLHHIDCMSESPVSAAFHAEEGRAAIGRLLEDLDSNAREVAADVDKIIEGGEF
jgi:hypothetical protein